MYVHVMRNMWRSGVEQHCLRHYYSHNSSSVSNQISRTHTFFFGPEKIKRIKYPIYLLEWMWENRLLQKLTNMPFSFCDLASIGTESCGEYQQNFLGKLQIRVTFLLGWPKVQAFMSLPRFFSLFFI